MVIDIVMPVLHHVVRLGADSSPAPSDPTNSTSGSFSFPSWLSPILSTGVVGIFLLLIVFRIKIMPTYVYEDAKKEWERQHAEDKAANEVLQQVANSAQTIYTDKLLPTLITALDMNREYLDTKRNETAEREAMARIDRQRAEQRRRRQTDQDIDDDD